jgi:thiol:disulfide interchange protein
MNPRSLITLTLLLILWVSASVAEPVRVGPVRVELIAEKTGIVPGEPINVGLYIVPDSQWHVYWKNPGDAGMPPILTWDLPEGFAAGDIVWTAPEKIPAGPLAGYGYHGDALYPLVITPPSDINVGERIRLNLKADWLVCKVECLPGSAKLSINLPVVAEGEVRESEYAPLFEEARRRSPLPLPDDWRIRGEVNQSHIILDLEPKTRYRTTPELEFFAAERAVIDHAADQLTSETDRGYRLELKRSSYSVDPPDSIIGVLHISDDGSENFYYDIAVATTSDSVAAVASTSSGVSSLLTALIFAFVGGLILNLMPCVLPVLSLKVLGLVNQAGQGRRSVIAHGIAFTMGVIVSFWVIVGVLLALRAGGAQLGWGFQLQSPVFVVILASFMFLFSLSLFGVFEIGFLAGAGNTMNQRKSSGLAGAFVSGITATLVATPCTAPFMGAALGYSLTQSVLTSILVHTFLALGMSAPYLLLSLFPELLRFIPKPGRWMESLKQALGFALVATVIWLGWVLAGQAGSTALVVLLLVLLMISFAAWIYGRWGQSSFNFRVRLLSRALAAVVLVTGIALGCIGVGALGFIPASGSEVSQSGIAWRNFDRELLQDLRSEGQAVFIDFTAAWCLSCQVNERVAFSSDEVQDRFKELNVVPLKADWTQRSDDISRALASYGRNSVPLYVLYGTNPSNDEPIILPELLTPGIVLDALEKIATP